MFFCLDNRQWTCSVSLKDKKVKKKAHSRRISKLTFCLESSWIHWAPKMCFFSQRSGWKVDLATGKKWLPDTRTIWGKRAERRPQGRKHMKEGRRALRVENDRAKQLFQTNRPTGTGLADSFIYLIVPFPLQKIFLISVISVASKWLSYYCL